ncbi:phospholipase B1, membrane-associated-like [Suncus etruscus]|uniref:phospholipase B1, membrane-associated-like n=1 Tax=Suncus etruscus TaxID=109475 RepID=UPI00210FC0C0|nr:phospholipase B1, membrane-associated-like [Suncus etruscus]
MEGEMKSWVLQKENTVRHDTCILGTQEAEEEGRSIHSDLWTSFLEVIRAAAVPGVDAAAELGGEEHGEEDRLPVLSDSRGQLFPGATQDQAFSNNSKREEEWPKLEIVKHLPLSCDPKILKSNIYSVSVNTLNPSDVKFVASIGIKETLILLNSVGMMEKQNSWPESSVKWDSVAQALASGQGLAPFTAIGIWKPDIRVQTGYEGKALKLDFKNDWKIINLFLSNTHECYLCPAVGQSSFVKSAMNKLTKTLDYLQQEVPRSFVNLVDLTDLLDFIALPGMKTQHSNNTKFCKCSEDRVPYKAYARMNYQELWESVLSSSKYNQKESFAVVFQPFFYDPDLSHLLEDQQLKDPSSLGVHLWNLMMEPAGQKVKPYSLRYRRLLACPPKGHPYLFTYKNSNFQPRFPPANQLFQPNDVRLKCSDMNPSWTIPNSVHQLKPADIKVVAAVGDSVLAAAGAEHRLQTFNSSLSDHHSLTWRSNAGNETLTNVLTLPSEYHPLPVCFSGSPGGEHGFDILRKFNSELIGYTLGHGMKYSAGARLNQAVSRDISMDMSNQVTEVIRKMKNDKFNITPEILQNGIQHALDILQGEVPRMVVNVVSPLEITSLNAIYKETENICPRDQLMKLCPCVMKFNEGAQEFDQVVNFNKKYQRLVEDLIYSGHYDKRHDFTVVLQPFLERFEMPRTEEGLPDLTYFDPDCFHFSQKTLGHIASALWNSMGHPYLMTSKNSVCIPAYCYIFGDSLWEAQQVSEDVIQCPDMSPSTNIPISVDKVKPADIKIVAALGGYLNAGRGAGSTSFSDLSNLLEFRGVAFSIGGDKELPSVKTLPNILRKFNSDIKGYSVLITKTYEDNEAWLNLATPQALTQQFRDQCERLVNRMKAMSGINYAQDWKLITVMIGYQDFCVFCDKRVLSEESYSTDKYVQYIKEGLDYLHNNDGKSDTSYFSFDCLSISQKGHGKLAYALWNNMLEDLGNKTRVFDFSVENSLMCPGMHQDWGSDFDCMYLEVSPHPPSSASKLQPADIQVVAAMGDWVTSAWGASPFTYDIPKAWKSVSWSTGGHKVLEKQTTLPNILLKFSSVIHGISRGSWPELAGLNVAEEEARVQDMPEQANKLLQLMEFNSDIDMDNDWKLITIFIGINDLCDYCKDQLPKVFINLVEVMDVTSFYPELGEHCVKTPLNCPCFHGMGDELKEELLKINMHFQDVAYKIPFSVDFSSREDFMVVTQPFFRKSTLLHKNDSSSYLSLNCQYFSSLMQNQMAIALWNNMNTPEENSCEFLVAE